MKENIRNTFVECPYCGKGTVTATVVTTFYCRKKYPLFKTGVEMDGETFEELYGEPQEPSMRFSSFYCSSCEKRFFPFQFDMTEDEDGNLRFEKREKR